MIRKACCIVAGHLAERAWTVHGQGMDEITITGETHHQAVTDELVIPRAGNHDQIAQTDAGMGFHRPGEREHEHEQRGERKYPLQRGGDFCATSETRYGK